MVVAATATPESAGLQAANLVISAAPSDSTNGNFPPDPAADIAWTAQNSAVLADVEAAFNHARSTENAQRGTRVPPMVLPSLQTWSNMRAADRALWLINRERMDRGVQPLDGVEADIEGVAQAYAQYLLDYNVFSHTADGRTPYQRMESRQPIDQCHDALPIAENLAVLGGTNPDSFAFPLERAVYAWLYEDQASGWGHRRTILWYPYDDNGGPRGKEGFLGIGVAVGGPYQGLFNHPYPWVQVVVMNVFDPCATWAYTTSRAYVPMVGR